MRDSIFKILTIFSLLIFFFFCFFQSRERVEQISPNFTLSEALGENDSVNNEIYENILYSAKRMEDVRSYLDSPIIVVSWYRTRFQNFWGGGARKSAHKKGLAVDFRAANTHDQRLIFNKLLKSNLSFDVIIYYKDQNFIHLGFKPEGELKNEKQLIMTK